MMPWHVALMIVVMTSVTGGVLIGIGLGMLISQGGRK